jgi:uncharacterized protein (TIGR03437 family)
VRDSSVANSGKFRIILNGLSDTPESKWDAGCRWALLAILFAAGFAPALTAQSIQITSAPVGAQPLGVAVIAPVPLMGRQDYAVVANSGDGSLSVYSFQALQSTARVQGIPDPHAVIPNCGPSTSFSPGVIVTSPSDNSVSFVQFSASGFSSNASITKVTVGKRPVSAACFRAFNSNGSVGDGVAAISNYGDQTVTLIDVNSHAVIATVPNIPGSPGLHGIGGVNGANPVAWIAGTDANLVTLLDIQSGKVLSQIPVDHPVAIQGTQVATPSAVLSFDPVTLQSSTVLASSGIQLLQSVPAGLGGRFAPFLGTVPGTGTFGLVSNSGTTSLDLFAGSDVFPIPEVVNPQDMAVEVPVFCTPSGVTCGPGGGRLVTTSRDTNSVIILTPPPGIGGDFSLRSGAGTGGLAPGGLGSALFVTTGATGAFTASPPDLPTTLGNVTLKIGGPVTLTPSGWVEQGDDVAVPLLYVDPRQINFQVPPGFSPPAATSIARIERPDGTELVGNYSMAASAPAIFTLNQTGFGAGAVLNQDNTVNSPSNPASRGSVIQIFATGGGDTTPLLVPGQLAPADGDPLIPMNVTPLVLIGTLKDQALNGPGELLFNGLAPGLLGVWQINARIPQNTTPGSQVPVSLYLLGSRTQSIAVTIAVN